MHTLLASGLRLKHNARAAGSVRLRECACTSLIRNTPWQWACTWRSRSGSDCTATDVFWTHLMLPRNTLLLSRHTLILPRHPLLLHRHTLVLPRHTDLLPHHTLLLLPSHHSTPLAVGVYLAFWLGMGLHGLWWGLALGCCSQVMKNKYKVGQIWYKLGCTASGGASRLAAARGSSS
jgi:hypothetical protein